MHDAAFDQAMREGVRGVPRRGLLGLAAGLFTIVRGGPDVVAKRKRRKKCKRPRIKCGKKCLAAGACCTNAECAAITGQICVANTCRCPSGKLVAGAKCAALCSPACGECQRCAAGACIDLADGVACTNGGKCQAGVCKPDPALGCTVAQDSCGASGAVLCPDSSTNDLFCFVDAEGNPVCGSALCTNDDTGAECPGLTGAGSIVVPCAEICVPAVNKTHMCVKPVEE